MNNKTLHDGKDDNGKLRAGCLADFSKALKAVAQVSDYGCKKYGRDTWKSVPNAPQRYDDAFWRHLLEGEGIDPESGLPHLWHVAWNVLAMIELGEINKK